MKFSICIPNYNYDKYLGQTIDSIINNDYKDFEIPIADNFSTDNSLEIIKKYASRNPEVKYVVNPLNLGFASNLDKAASLATGERIIMLSSDDLMQKEALTLYNQLLSSVSNQNAIISSSMDVIDPDNNVVGKVGFPYKWLWLEKDFDAELSKLLDLKVYKVEASELLKRSLVTMTNPFNFCSVCYPNDAYKAVGGYGSGRLINPDKWFNWKLLSVVDFCYFIDQPLFQYRWHPQNQTAQQKKSGHLKYLIDEYRNTIEISTKVLKEVGLTRNDIYKSFVKYDIIKHGIGELAKLNYFKSWRIFFFGIAAYPGLFFTSIYSLPTLAAR